MRVLLTELERAQESLASLRRNGEAVLATTRRGKQELFPAWAGFWVPRSQGEVEQMLNRSGGADKQGNP